MEHLSQYESMAFTGDAEGEASIFFKENHLKKMEYRRRQDP